MYFDDKVPELVEALREFRRRYNEQWLIERHGYRTPAQVPRLRGIGIGGRMTAHAGPVGTGRENEQEFAPLITMLTGPVSARENQRHGPGRPQHARRDRPRTAYSPPQSRRRRDRSVTVPSGTRRTSS
jgi:hypothetical protein